MKTKIPVKFLLCALIFSVFVTFRILNLLNQSPFVDEAYYVHLASSIRENLSINNLFFPLDQGLSPVFMYLTAISMFLFKNPMFAGRFTSFLIFLASIFIFARYLKKIKAKNFVLPLIFFSFNPFLFLYSQMALLETSMIFFAVLFMLLTEMTISSKKIFVFSLFLVMNLYLVIFSKATGVFIVFYALVRFWQEKKYKTLMTFIVLSFAVGIIFFPILKLLFATVKMHGHSRALSFPDFLKNARLIHIWMIDYYKLVSLLLFLSIAFFYRKNKIVWAVTLTILIVLLMVTISSASFFPRYLIITSPLLAILLSNVMSKKVIILSILLFIVLYVKTNYNIMFNLKNADIAKEDIYQYSTDWTSGKNILNILNRVKENSKICVTSDYYFYFVIVKQSYFQNKNINVATCNKGFNPMSL